MYSPLSNPLIVIKDTLYASPNVAMPLGLMQKLVQVSALRSASLALGDVYSLS